MKKILISKFHERSPSPPKINTSDNHENGDSKERPNIWPPLPVGPPPEYEVLPIIEIKKEILDEGYQSLSSDSSPDPPILDENVKKKKEEESDPRPMCKRFARGTCSKGSSCIYKHEIVLSQLKSLYRFCWDFQNKTCSRPYCKHVHASIFEEQNFYRTGYLPPKALAHLQDNPELANDNNNGQQKKWHTPEKLDKFSNDLKLPRDQVLNMPSSNVQNFAMANHEPKADIRVETKSLKRSWSSANASCSGVPDSAASKRRCTKCEVNLFRVEINSNRMEDTMRSVVRLRESVEELDSKAARLKYVTQGLLALEDDKSFEDFLKKVVTGKLEVTVEKAIEITQAVSVLINLQKAMRS